MAGGSKMFVPQEKMAATGSSAQWVLDFGPGALKATGAVELPAAVGLILPAGLGVAPVLVPLAASRLPADHRCTSRRAPNRQTRHVNALSDRTHS
ncbi:DoxX family protein [Streptomyces sp. NPDC005009]